MIGLLSGPAADGSFEDEASRQQYDPAQFDSWRNSLTKVRCGAVRVSVSWLGGFFKCR